MNAITTTHNLDFFAAPYERGMLASVMIGEMDGPPVIAYKVGTCEGIYQVTETSYDIIAIVNNEPGNGHFEDVLEWFEFAAKRDKRNLRFVAIMNDRFGKHLCEKRGFKMMPHDNAIKKFV